MPATRVGTTVGPTGATARVSVLVIEDDDDLATLLVQSLARMGYEARHAPRGAHALDLLQRDDPDVLVFDIGSPSRDGTEIARIARDRRGRDFPIIAITGYEDPAVHQGALSAGCDVVLLKPFHLPVLCEAMERLRGRHASP